MISLDLDAALDVLADQMDAQRAEILGQWHARVAADAESLGVSHMTRSQFYDHIPLILAAFFEKLRSAPENAEKFAQDARETDMAQQHSKHRWQQGYKVRSLVREWGHLNGCMVEAIDALEAEAEVLSRVRILWAEFVNHNVSEGVSEYESLLQTEAGARLDELEEAIQIMRIVETERGELLRQVSHDLRGGLSMVAGASSLLGHDKIAQGDREHVMSILHGGVRSVTDMLGDLMTMSRLEAGHEKCEIARFDAAQMLIELCGNCELLAREKGLFLRGEGEKSLMVEGDSAKVRRIAQNLMINALKYTTAGGVDVSWQAVSKEQWSFTISDTGPGLSRSSAAPLADKIAQATEGAHQIGAQITGEMPLQNSQLKEPQAALASTSLAWQPGEGIGLSIVRRLCELLNATLELETGAGHGSTFRVVLPRGYESEKAKNDENPA
ncbi:sensor histidine kinase [Abditibacterium utsteinense]|nr:HAMP domain-containing sensor histidine kinase [Abditibacterium utsteinense]